MRPVFTFLLFTSSIIPSFAQPKAGESTGSDSVWSPHKTKIAYVVSWPNPVQSEFGFFNELQEIRVYDITKGTTVTLVRTDTNISSPQSMLVHFTNLEFSNDGTTLYFIVPDAWEKTDALHRVTVKSKKENFVVDCFSFRVIREGVHKGDIIAWRLYYDEGGPGSSPWIMSPDGKKRTAITDEEAKKYWKEK
jgi:hypothetical protein